MNSTRPSARCLYHYVSPYIAFDIAWATAKHNTQNRIVGVRLCRFMGCNKPRAFTSKPRCCHPTPGRAHGRLLPKTAKATNEVCNRVAELISTRSPTNGFRTPPAAGSPRGLGARLGT